MINGVQEQIKRAIEQRKKCIVRVQESSANCRLNATAGFLGLSLLVDTFELTVTFSVTWPISAANVAVTLV